MADQALSVFPVVDNFGTVGTSPVATDFMWLWDASAFGGDDNIVAVYPVLTGGFNDGTGCLFNDSPHSYVTVRNFTDSSDLVTINYYMSFPNWGVGSDIKSYLPNAAAGEKILQFVCGHACGTSSIYMNFMLYVVFKAPGDGGAVKGRVILPIGYSSATRSTTPTEVDSKRLLWDSANFGTGAGGNAGIASVRLGASLKYQTATAGHTGYARLYDITNASSIVDLSTTLDTPGYYVSSDIKSSLTDASELTVQIYRTIPGGVQPALNTIISNAHLIIDIDDCQKFETHFIGVNENHSNTNFTTNGFVDNDRSFFPYKDYAVGVTKVFYAESVGKKNHASDLGYLRLEDDGSAVTNGETQHTTTAYSRYRPASALTEPADGSKMNIEGKGYTTTSSTLNAHCTRMIMFVSGFDREVAASGTAPALLLLGVGT